MIQRIVQFGRMIKFSHSVFALPFALVSGMTAYKTGGVTFTWVDVLLLTVCMVSARTTAMGFNRIVDRDIDAVNPRTKNREIPAGKISVREAVLFTTLAAAVFVGAAFAVNTLCGVLALPLLGLLCGYSLTKRYTSLSHFVLGLCLGAAPVGVWFAMTGKFAWEPVMLCLGVTLWTAGFDIYYSCQDENFDRGNRLNSLPARLGAMQSIRLVRPIHLLAVACYTGFGIAAGMQSAFYVGVGLVAVILVYEAWLLRRGDLTKINLAFFNLNGYVSVIFAVSVLLDLFVLRK